MQDKNIAASFLHEIFEYDAKTFDLRWKINAGRQPAGGIAGSKSPRGYIQISIKGKKYYAHRIIWAMHNGKWPEFFIDHIDGNKSNNNISNLRDVKNNENMQNMKAAAANKKSGSKVPGVHFCKKRQKYVIMLVIDGKRKVLGSFVNLHDAESNCLDLRRSNYSGNTI